MAEQALSSDRETVLPVPPAQQAPTEEPRPRRHAWFGITLVRLAVLLAAGVVVVLSFAGCCERTASGHATVVLPNRIMRSRRVMRSPRRHGRAARRGPDSSAASRKPQFFAARERANSNVDDAI